MRPRRRNAEQLPLFPRSYSHPQRSPLEYATVFEYYPETRWVQLDAPSEEKLHQIAWYVWGSATQDELRAFVWNELGEKVRRVWHTHPGDFVWEIMPGWLYLDYGITLVKTEPRRPGGKPMPPGELTRDEIRSYINMWHEHFKGTSHIYDWGYAIYNGIPSAETLIGVALVGPTGPHTGRMAAEGKGPRVVKVLKVAINRDIPRQLTYEATGAVYDAAAEEAWRRGYDFLETYTLFSESGNSMRYTKWRPPGISNKEGRWRLTGIAKARKSGRRGELRVGDERKWRWWKRLTNNWPWPPKPEDPRKNNPTGETAFHSSAIPGLKRGTRLKPTHPSKWGPGKRLAETVFEDVRRKEFPHQPSRIGAIYAREHRPYKGYVWPHLYKVRSSKPFHRFNMDYFTSAMSTVNRPFREGPINFDDPREVESVMGTLVWLARGYWKQEDIDPEATGYVDLELLSPKGTPVRVVGEVPFKTDPVYDNPPPLDWREHRYGRRPSNQEMEDAERRVLSAGARPPLSYMGAGAQGIVFCGAEGHAWKAARGASDPKWSESRRAAARTEYEWLKAAGENHATRHLVPKVYAFHDAEAVIERGCPRGKPPSWDAKWSEWHKQLTVPGWKSPEAGRDQWIVTKQGPVIVDGGYAIRRGEVLAKHVEAILDGRIPAYGESLKDMAWSIYVDTQQLHIPPWRGAELLRRIRAAGDDSEFSSEAAISRFIRKPNPPPAAVMRKLKGKVGAGDCYAASELVYHAGGGKHAGLTPVQKRHQGESHWWVRGPNGKVYDPTAHQYSRPVNYAKGRGRGFLTKKPSRRARELGKRVGVKVNPDERMRRLERAYAAGDESALGQLARMRWRAEARPVRGLLPAPAPRVSPIQKEVVEQEVWGRIENMRDDFTVRNLYSAMEESQLYALWVQLTSEELVDDGGWLIGSMNGWAAQYEGFKSITLFQALRHLEMMVPWEHRVRRLREAWDAIWASGEEAVQEAREYFGGEVGFEDLFLRPRRLVHSNPAFKFDVEKPVGPQAIKLAHMVRRGEISAEDADTETVIMDILVETGHDRHFMELLKKTIDRYSGKAKFMESVKGARNLHLKTKKGMHLMVTPAVQSYAEKGATQVTRFFEESGGLAPMGHSHTTGDMQKTASELWGEYGPLELVERRNPASYSRGTRFELSYSRHGTMVASAYADGRLIGRVQATESMRYWDVGMAKVLDAYRRQGIARKLYQMLSEEACRRGKPIRSQGYQRSKQATNLWESFSGAKVLPVRTPVVPWRRDFVMPCENPQGDESMRRFEREAKASGEPAALAELARRRARAGEEVQPWEKHPASYIFLRAYEQGPEGRVEVTRGGKTLRFYVSSNQIDDPEELLSKGAIVVESSPIIHTVGVSSRARTLVGIFNNYGLEDLHGFLAQNYIRLPKWFVDEYRYSVERQGVLPLRAMQMTSGDRLGSILRYGDVLMVPPMLPRSILIATHKRASGPTGHGGGFVLFPSEYSSARLMTRKGERWKNPRRRRPLTGYGATG